MKKPVIAVFFGGCSTEYQVSLQSAHAVLTHLDREKYQVLTVGITREGHWLYYTGPLDRIADGAWYLQKDDCRPCTVSPDRGRGELLILGNTVERLTFDAAFPVLHGKNGEDGTVQGLLELTGVPLVGCGVLSSALCMDKHRAHQLAALSGVAVPEGAVFSAGTEGETLLETAGRLGYPLFVKPVRAGSSFGVTRVERPEQLEDAVEEALCHDSQVLLEEAVPGFEVGCAVMGNERLTLGLLDEIELSQGFFNYEEKYTLRTSRIHCPARITAEQTDRIRQAAATVYQALDCRVFARVDLFLAPDGRIIFNEVNTIPGFTAHSRYPNMMRGIGLEFGQLLDRLIDLAMGR